MRDILTQRAHVVRGAREELPETHAGFTPALPRRAVFTLEVQRWLLTKYLSLLPLCCVKSIL